MPPSSPAGGRHGGGGPPTHINIGAAFDDDLGGSGSGGSGSGALSPLGGHQQPLPPPGRGVGGGGGGGGGGGRHSYHSALHVLCHEGPKRRGNWDRVLVYVERHSSHSSVFSTKTGPKPPAGVLDMSPLDRTLIPSEELRDTGLRREGPDGDDTPLRVAVTRGAPAGVVAALCQLFPAAAGLRDEGGRVPLHHAARKPTGGAVAEGGRGDHDGPGQDAHNVLKVLSLASPESAAVRDGRGMTPLHVLFSVHAESRSVATVELLCRNVDTAFFNEEIARQKEENARLAEREELDGKAGTSAAAATIGGSLLLPTLGADEGGGGSGTQLGGINEGDDEEASEQGIEIGPKSPGGNSDTFTFRSPARRAAAQAMAAFAPAGPKIRPLPRLPSLPRTPPPTVGASAPGTRTASDDSSGRNVPPNPAVVPDSIHGCLPLHYAVMNGATLPALRYVLGKYPSAIRKGDRYGRTALGWYLGGSEWEAEEKELDVEREYAAAMAHLNKQNASGGGGGDDQSVADEEGTVVGGRGPSYNNNAADRNARIMRSDDPAELRRKIGFERARGMKSVTGAAGDLEDFLPASSSPRARHAQGDAAARLLHRHRRSSAVISLLCNQSVARMYDGKRRLPLHFAVRLYVLSLLDPSDEAIAEMDAAAAPSKKSSKVLPPKSGHHHHPTPPGCVALKAVQLVVDTNRQALVHPDAYGRTPLHVLFATAHTWNKREYHSLVRNERLNGRYVDGSWRKGAIGARPFRPPTVLAKLLLQRAVGVVGEGGSGAGESESTGGRRTSGGGSGRSTPQDSGTMSFLSGSFLGRGSAKSTGSGDGGTGSGASGSGGGGNSSSGFADHLDDDDFHGGDDADDSDDDSYSDEGNRSSSALSSSGGGASSSARNIETSPFATDDSATLATHAEDRWGLLPLHYAVVSVAPAKILKAMVRSHPASLLYTTYGPEEKSRDSSAAAAVEKETEDGNSEDSSKAVGGGSPVKSPAKSRRALGGLSRTPLHLAFSSPYTTRLHTLKTLAPLLDSLAPPQPENEDPVESGRASPPRNRSGFRSSSKKHLAAQEKAETEAAAAAAAIDGRLALKMEDGTGRYPLHLAAEHGASAEVLAALLVGYEASARIPNRRGDLPVHLLLDSHLLMNVEVLALGEDGGDGDEQQDRAFQLDGSRLGSSGAASLDEFHRIKARRAKVRTLSAQSARLARTGVGGAVFGQLHGWTSDEDEARHIRSRRELMKKAHLLLKPLLEHRPSLTIADSRHGMTPLHIGVAFHAATYGEVHAMLRTLPSSSRARTTISAASDAVDDGEGVRRGYTALDLHVLRRRFPAEVPPAEMDGSGSWHAVRELIFSYEIHPLGSAVDAHFPDAFSRRGSAVSKANLAMYRRDRDLLMRCVGAIRAEAGGLGRSAHGSGDEAPVDPVHVEIGLVEENAGVVGSKKSAESGGSEEKKDGDDEDNVALDPNEEDGVTVGESGSSSVADTSFELGDVASRLWTFLATFQDRSNPADHYAPYVECVVSDMNFRAVQFLVTMRLPDCCASERTGTLRNLTGLTVRDCAHVHCKAVMHSTFYFAGLYDFTPPPPPSLGAAIAAGNGSSGDDNGSGDEGDGSDRPRGQSILLHRGPGGRTLLLRATEHRFTTDEGSSDDRDQSSAGGNNADGGVEVSAMDNECDDPLADPSAHNRLLSTFRVTARPVCVKFMADAESYRREIKMRARILGDMGGGLGLIAPVLADYDATSGEGSGNSKRTRGQRRSDRRYRNDVRDPRFETLPLYHSSDGAADAAESPTASSSVESAVGAVGISKYPYAIVLPLSTESDLGAMFERGAVDDLDDVKRAGLQVGRGLRFMHSKGVIHCNVGMGNVIEYPGKNENHRSVLTDFTYSNCLPSSDNVTYLGEISSQGVPRFSPAALPPEMFAKLTSPQFASYEAYWDAVGSIDGITVDRAVVEPWIHPENGEVYVVKCYCNVGKEKLEEHGPLPPLPYDLVPPSAAIDLWSFGLMLFGLCSGGHSLFCTSGRTAEFLTLEGIASWSDEIAEQTVCGLIKDPVTQDILLHLLGSEERRVALTMEAMLGHPFFAKEGDLPEEVRLMLGKMSQQRVQEKEKKEAQRERDNAKKAEDDWVDGRTSTVSCPTLDLRMKMIHSSYELMKVLLGATDAAPVMPRNFIVLPYKLIRNKSGRLTPSHKKDVEMAEKVGRLVLGLSRAAVFVQAMEAGLRKDVEKAKEATQRWASACEAYGEGSDETQEAAAVMEAVKKGVLTYIGLDTANFMDLASAYVAFIRAGREEFLSDPLFTARKIIHDIAKTLLGTYATSKASYLYLVDEYKGVPIIPPAKEDGSKPCYPHVITENVTSVVTKALPFMQMSIINARANAGGISGLVRLIFEGAYPHIPPSWSSAAIGLDHYMDRETMVGEVQMLRGALEEMSGHLAGGATGIGDEELHSFEAFFGSFDRDRSYAGLQRITDGKVSLWTAKANIGEIESECDNANAVKIFRALESKGEEIREKNKKIAELEKALQAMSSKGSRGKAKR